MTELVIEAGRTEREYWRDLWRYRELFYFLAWRDLLVRYKQTFVGVGWSLIRPLLTMLVLTVVFGKLGKMPSGGMPYPLLVLCGMLPWQFFSGAMSESGNSLVSSSNLITKVYFPRLPDLRHIFGCVDVLVPHHTASRRPAFAVFCTFSFWRLAWDRPMDFCPHG
jgi:lipopolysaccharide transport system permease protein